MTTLEDKYCEYEYPFSLDEDKELYTAKKDELFNLGELTSLYLEDFMWDNSNNKQEEFNSYEEEESN